MGAETLGGDMGTQGTPSKPRLCVVSTTPLVVHFFIRPHLVALAEHYDVTLVLNQNNDSYSAPLDLPVRMVSMGIMRNIAPWRDLISLWHLYHLFRQERFDQIWAVVPKAGLLSMVAGLAAGIRSRVFIFQGEVWATRRGFARMALKAIDRLIAWCSTDVLAVSLSEQDLLEREKIVPPGRLTVLGAGSICGVDLTRFAPNPAVRQRIREDLNIPADAVMALYLGRLKEEKGVIELVTAFARTNTQTPLYLVFVGPDEANITQRLQSMMPGIESRVRMLGYTAQPEHFMAAADFICLPSHREGFGMVVVEAAAAGAPAIGSKVTGVVDAIVENVTGLQFPVKDIGQISLAMARMTDDTELRRRLGQAAQARVAQLFEQGAVVQRYVTYLLGVLNKP